MRKIVVVACMCMFALGIFAVSVEAAPVQKSDSSSFQPAPSDMNCGGCEAKKECPKGEKQEGCCKDKKECPKDKESCDKKATCPKAEKEGA